MPFKSKFPDIQVPDGQTDILSLLFESTKYPKKNEQPVLIDGISGRVITFGGLIELVEKITAGLQHELNFKAGETVAIFSPNQVDYSAVMFGVVAAGGTVALVNGAYNENELQYHLQEADATVLFCHEDNISTALKAADKAGIPRNRVLLFGDKVVNGVKPYTSVLVGKRRAKHIKYSAEEAKTATAYLPFSSGTTGTAKGVMLTHSNITANVLQFTEVELQRIDLKQEKIIGVLPFYHVFGLTCLLQAPLYWGVPVITLPRFELTSFCTAMQSHRITIGILVPPILILLAKHPDVGKYDFSSLREIICGAAPLSAQLARDVSSRLGGTVVKQGYGMSETSPVATMEETHDVLEGCVGILLPSMEAKIIDDNGNEVGNNERGELWMKGPNIMLGYTKRKEETANTVDRDGYLHSGDVAIRDDNGRFYIVDRIKELIKYKGLQVAPAELESLLLKHPKIIDCAVIGVHSEEKGTELPRAYVVVPEDVPRNEKTAQEIQDYVIKSVVDYKKLRGGIVFLDAIPKLASGKILRRVLRDRAANEAVIKPKL
ncbi:hypothetical protein BC943DRAFT_360097 [Umbelopsis sp. AD052]|nr:hypothetical protein BC943DRAFT_360097 [Umbelopsis sp. AD052]